MKALIFLLLLSACGSSSPAPLAAPQIGPCGGDDLAGAYTDVRGTGFGGITFGVCEFNFSMENGCEVSGGFKASGGHAGSIQINPTQVGQYCAPLPEKINCTYNAGSTVLSVSCEEVDFERFYVE